MHVGSLSEGLCPKASKDGWPVTFSCLVEMGGSGLWRSLVAHLTGGPGVSSSYPSMRVRNP